MVRLGHTERAAYDARRVAEALIGLKRTCPLVVFLGSYPAADPTPTPVAPGTADDAFVDAEQWVRELIDPLGD